MTTSTTSANTLFGTDTSNGSFIAGVDCVKPFRLRKYDKIQIDREEMTPTRKTREGYVLTSLSTTAISQEYSFADLHHLYQEGRLEVTADYYSESTAMNRLRQPLILLADMGEDERNAWSARVRKVEMFLASEAKGRYRRSDASIREFLAHFVAEQAKEQTTRSCGKLEVGKGHSPTNFRKLLRRFEACHHDPLALVDGYGRAGNRDKRIVGKERKLLEQCAAKFASNLRPTKKELYREMKDAFREQLPESPVPSYATLSRTIDNLDLWYVLAARHGEDKARKKLYPVREKLVVHEPMERVEIDECLMPLQTLLEDAGQWETLPEVVKDGVKARRWWYSKAIDCATRVILGFVITSAPSTLSALATVRMALQDKSELARAAGCEAPWSMFGLPTTIVTDNGSAFISAGFREALLNLGIHHIVAPAANPQQRGRVERSMRTDHEGLFAKFPGRTFGDILAKGDYDAVGNVSAAIEVVARLMVRYYVDIYHNTPHAGLAGDTPLNVWKKTVARYGVIAPPSGDRIRHVLGTPREASVGNEGIRSHNLTYQSETLQEVRRRVGRRKIMFRLDETDIGRWVQRIVATPLI